ncbi:SMI1/KNR4 family protein [Pyxidicoccus xibeiensis]|uniref:SMI1/KNR4 family protein n=1 Tax=Pyxidicoccus xibeiensis TaxID=2906759 RepID=UPI0020A7128B|nr:SMI1/KNR4 family protein [Pyxidicoccus xibeiensis]MCP3143889.1 SMI1/KNR4 family protein [Pyxidicoccus xibeiensis]
MVLPPSYRQLLRVSNGIPGYMQAEHLSLRSAGEIVASQDDDTQWDEHAPLHRFVIASGETYEFIAFDGTRSDATGEAPLIWVDPRRDVTELEGFEAFLLAQLHFQKDVLEE